MPRLAAVVLLALRSSSLVSPDTVRDGPALTLLQRRRGIVADRGTPLTIELSRWSTDAERAPLLAALAPPPPRCSAAPNGPGCGGCRARGAVAAGWRGGRAGAAAAEPDRAADDGDQGGADVGFIWGDGVTGYSIKYAWRAPAPAGVERIVLVTDRASARTPAAGRQPARARRPITSSPSSRCGSTAKASAKARPR